MTKFPPLIISITANIYSWPSPSTIVSWLQFFNTHSHYPSSNWILYLAIIQTKKMLEQRFIFYIFYITKIILCTRRQEGEGGEGSMMIDCKEHRETSNVAVNDLCTGCSYSILLLFSSLPPTHPPTIENWCCMLLNLNPLSQKGSVYLIDLWRMRLAPGAGKKFLLSVTANQK